MKISQVFKLNKTQHELDFVDIDTAKDKAVFLDPFFISTRKHPWCIAANATIRKFYQLAIDYIKLGQLDKACSIFIHLNEPNETCLGLSKGRPSGRGVAGIQSQQILESIIKSKAAKTGLVDDLEDTAIFIENVDKDKVSDITTNIIKKHLLEYTIEQCNLWGITLTESVPTGFYWDSIAQKWDQKHEKRLVINHKPLLLIPKMAVSFYKNYVSRKYYQHFVLNYLQDENLLNNTSLVQSRKLKSGVIKKFVTKKDIEEKQAPYTKEYLRNFTEAHPDIFVNFRSETSDASIPISNDSLETINIQNLVDHLISQLESIPTGKEQAGRYHVLMIGILELIFYPNLTNPRKEKPINDGRKRIDITFDNSSTSGFFFRTHNTHQIPSSYIFGECKNYFDDPVNPEIDQLSGRFNVNSSMVGLLICRTIDDKSTFIKRCQDLWKQKKELVLPLTDKDVKKILLAIKDGTQHSEENLLADLQREIIVS